MKHAVFAAMLAIAACAAGTAQAATEPGVCLQPIRFDGWKVIDNRTVIITDKFRKNFKLSLAPGCFEVDFAMRLGIKSFSPSQLSCVSRGDYVVVPSDVGIRTQRCMITKVEAYTPEMAQADALAKAAAKSQH